MKKTISRLMSLFVLLAVIAAVICGCKMERPSKYQDKLYDANKTAVKFTVGDVNITSDSEGKADVMVELPDYKELYIKAVKKRDPEKFVYKALINKDFNIKKEIVTADVVIENGKEVVKAEEAVENLLKHELKLAMNRVYEEEQKNG